MIRTIAVCGAGTMGSGIAQVASMGGYQTVLYDLDENMVEKGKQAIQKNLQTLTEKNKLTPNDRAAIEDRLTFTSDINHCKADLIIEAIIEKTQAKTNLFQRLASINSSETILASN